MEEILNRLGELVEKQKKSKLSRSDISAAIDMLKVLASDKSMRDKLLALLVVLPSEVCSQTVLGILPEITEEEKNFLISSILQSHEFEKYPGQLRQLDLIKELISKFSHLALYLLLNLVERVTEGASKQASSGYLKKFEGLLTESDLLSLSLEGSFPDAQFSALSLIVVGCFTESETKNDELILNTLTWLKSIDRKAIVSKPLKKRLETDTRYWSSDSKTILLQLGLVNNLIDAERITSEVKVSYQEKKTTGESVKENLNQTSINLKNEHIAEVKSKLENSSEFDTVRSLLDKLEKKSKEINEKLLKEEAEHSRSKLNREHVSRKLEETEGLLARANSRILEIENTITQQSSKINNLEELLVQKEHEYKENQHALMDMRDQQAEHKTEVLKNKLRKRLKIEYVDFNEIQSEEMTVQLGENIRAQIKSIFSILDSEGIKF